MNFIQILALRNMIFPLPIISAPDGTQTKSFLIASWVMPPLAIRKCVCPNAQICSVIQKIVTKYLLSFQIACLVRSLEFNKIFDLLSAHVAFLTPPLDCSGTVNTKQVSTWPCCSSNFANLKCRNLANWTQR